MKMKLSGSVLFLLMAFTGSLPAQEAISEGKVVYKISYPEMELDNQMASMLPSESVIYFKEDKSRTEMSMGMGIHSVTIVNSKTNEITTLMDMMGTKTATIITEDGVKKEKGKNAERGLSFELVNESREIAGYPCKKAIMKNTDGSVFEMYYTENILSQSPFGNKWENFNGFPMEYIIDSGGFNLKLSASSVSGEEVNDDLFRIPDGYKLMTQEEFSKMLGGEEGK